MGIFNSKPKLKILFVTSEEAPFAKVGGLGEVMFALPRALHRLGYDARVMIPRYGTIDLGLYKLPVIYEELEVPTSPEAGGKRLRCNLRRFDPTGKAREPVTTYFLENQEYYELRSNAYGYIDDRIRFALLSRGCLEFLNLYKEWMPDVIITTDWMTGFLPGFLKTEYRDYRRLKGIANIFSIHNLGVHGTFLQSRFIPEMERDDGHSPVPDFFSERMKYINGMRRGIMHADIITTVSPTYAKEILTEEFGEGMEGLLRERRDRLYGILNGIDYETVNPATDTFLAKRFTQDNLDARGENKAALQQRFGLPQNKDVFLIGITSRLTRQKGFELLRPIIEPFLKYTQAQLVVVGTGDTALMDSFLALETKFPQQVRTHLQFDETLPHLVFSGVDVLLIPSLFEPSGLIQMEAMRFGAVPIARRVGGLADTLMDYNPCEDTGTGFLFDDFDSSSLLITLVRAHVNWRHREAWRKLQKRVMDQDFSWDRSAHEYVSVFERAIQLHEEDMSK